MTSKKQERILIVDDEVELANILAESLADHGYSSTAVNRGADGLAALRSAEYDLILSDLMMPEMDGLAVLREALKIDPTLVGIIMTGQGTIATAIDAMKIGAFDYVLKPFDLRTMLPIIERGLEMRRLRLENTRLRRYVERLSYESPRYQMIGAGPAMQKIVQLIEKVAPTDATVLVRGESGTGKELVARALHHNSERAKNPLVTINCAALQETLLESELFGHERGAFTGALNAKPGLIEIAEGGTLFIDEVGEMVATMQAKLLRVLEDGHFRRVGGTKESNANVRIVAATNKPLEAEQKAGRFREDLFYRLNVVSIDLPPLRERREDIPLLIEHFLQNRQLGKAACTVQKDALDMLINYYWPGNVRELANVLERAQILAENYEITTDDLPEMLRRPSGPVSVGSSLATPASPTARPEVLNLEEREREAIVIALDRTRGNKVHAAKLLGVTRRTLYRLITRYGLDRAESETPKS